MPASGSALLVAALTFAVLGGTSGASAAEAVDHRTYLTFTDPAISESSGLVAGSRLMFTVNDSGDGPLVYLVDRTGDTVGVTTYSAGEVTDVEALAPGPEGSVWVGDIGDNDEERPSVDVYRVPVGQARGASEVDAERFRLAYPDGPHDAEALLADPRTGRLYIVSKGMLGGGVYAAPASLAQDAVNRLRDVGHVPGLVTDGTFLPDGKHILLRSYRSAAVYTFPGMRQVGTFDLPTQPQGEAVAVDRRGRFFLSTEGVHTDVLQVALPPQVNAALGHDGPTELPSTPPPQAADPTFERPSSDEGRVIWLAAGILLATVVGWLAFTVSRRRTPRIR